MDVDQESISSKKQKASDCFSVCSLRGIDDLRGKISEQIFARNFNYNFFFLVITFPYPKKEVVGGERSGILPLVYVCKLFSFEVLALLVTLMSGRVPS